MSKMEKVTGIGGRLFLSPDPVALALWYQEHLRFKLTASGYEESPWQQGAGATAIAPFPEAPTIGSRLSVWTEAL